MKKKLCFLLIACFSLALCGCEGRQASADLSLEPIMASVMQSQIDLPAMMQVTSQDADFAAFLTGDYGIDPLKVLDGLVAYADGVEASEIVLLALAEERDAPAAQKALMEYAQRRARLFDGYAPMQAATARSARAIASGRYVALLICPDADAAEAALLNGFGEGAQSSPVPDVSAEPSPEAEPPADAQAEEAFNADAILQAWRTGDASALSERNLQILSAAKEVVAQEITDAMSAYEKELAIHDWLTHWSSFDMSAFSRNPGVDGGADSDTPYGVLMNRSGNCWGYASTFQLLMDMLDIECITVYGLPRSSGAEHAWNMIRLDGEWYCVDAAWDDPIGGSLNHQYFNKTSEAFRSSGIHHWDESAYPEATGTAYAYR